MVVLHWRSCLCFPLSVDVHDSKLSSRPPPLAWPYPSRPNDFLTVFYFGAPQFDEDELELYEMDTDGFEEQRSNLGNFLIDNVVVS